MASSRGWTFARLEREWAVDENDARKRVIWEDLAGGGWIEACGKAAKRGDKATLARWIASDGPIETDVLNEDRDHAGVAAARASLACALALAGRSSLRGTVDRALTPLAHSSGRPLNFYRDLASLFFAGRLPEPLRSQSIRAPFVRIEEWRDKRGESQTRITDSFMRKIALDLLPGGQGRLYAAPEMEFYLDGERFIEAIEKAATIARNKGFDKMWKGKDVRWSLDRNESVRLSALDGGSAAGAFAIGLLVLLAGPEPP